MRRFFTDFASLDSFTRSLFIHQSQTQCPHCLKHDQFVSHGLIYKQRSIIKREPVGKRLLCSNRYGRSGCGRTVQLHIAECIPRIRYSASVISTFTTLLLARLTISQAYQQATGQFETRNAWRWIAKLMAHLSQYRCLLNTRTKADRTQIKSRSKSLHLLLPTLTQLKKQCSKASLNLCAAYQQQQQRCFM